MVKKTALLLDQQLIDEAKRVLGVRTTTEAVHLALSEVVAREARMRLFERFRTLEGTDIADPDVMSRAWR